MRLGLVSLLSGEATISALVSTRVYLDYAPQRAALPHIIVEQGGSDELPALDGMPGMRFVDFEIICRADRAVEADTLGKAVRVFLDDYTGAAGSETISAVLINGEVAGMEEPVKGSDVGIHTTILGVTIQYAPA